MSVEEKRALFHYLNDAECEIADARNLLASAPDADHDLLQLVDGAGEHLLLLRRQLKQEFSREFDTDIEREDE